MFNIEYHAGDSQEKEKERKYSLGLFLALRRSKRMMSRNRTRKNRYQTRWQLCFARDNPVGNSRNTARDLPRRKASFVRFSTFLLFPLSSPIPFLFLSSTLDAFMLLLIFVCHFVAQTKPAEIQLKTMFPLKRITIIIQLFHNKF